MGTAVDVRSRSRVRLKRLLIGIGVVIVVAMIVAGAVLWIADGLSPDVIAAGLHSLPQALLIGVPIALILLAVGIPLGLWEWKRVARARAALRRQRRIEELRPLATILGLTPETLDKTQAATLQAITKSQDFEDLMAKVLAAHGYRDVHVVGQTGDHGIDLTGKTPDGKRMIIGQCKRYAEGNNVSEPTVRDFLGASYDFSVHHQAPVALFLATSGYTEAARKFANGLNSAANPNQISLQLFDGEQLARMVRELVVH